MSPIYILSILICVTIADEGDFNKMMQLCKVKEGASDTEFLEFMAKKRPTNRMKSCLGACIMETLGVLKDDQFSYDGVVELSRKANDEKLGLIIANGCRNVRGTDRCDVFVKFDECIRTIVSAKTTE